MNHISKIGVVLTLGVATAGLAAPGPEHTSGPIVPRASQATLQPVIAPTSSPLAVVEEMRSVNTQYGQAREFLMRTDPRVTTYTVAAEMAEDAYQDKLKELADASSETARFRAQAEALQREITSSALPIQKRREAARRNRELLFRVETAEDRIGSNPEALRRQERLGRAQAALDARIAEIMKTDPRTAAIAARREELMKQMEELAKIVPPLGAHAFGTSPTLSPNAGLLPPRPVGAFTTATLPRAGRPPLTLPEDAFTTRTLPPTGGPLPRLGDGSSTPTLPRAGTTPPPSPPKP